MQIQDILNIYTDYKLQPNHIVILYLLRKKRYKELMNLTFCTEPALTYLERREFIVKKDPDYGVSHLDNLEVTIKNKFFTDNQDLDERFEEFWKAYPSSDKFSVFPRSRILRTSKDKCKKLYTKIISSGVEPDDLLNAINFEVKMRKKTSALEGRNDFKYMKAIPTWLNNKEYEALFEQMTEEPAIDDTKRFLDL